MSSPASSTIGFRPRSSTCAAAARPTGPAPIIATVLVSRMMSSCKTRIIEVQTSNKKLCCPCVILRGGIGATFRHQKIDQSSHHVIVGVAYQRRCLPHLTDEADHHQGLDVMRERRRRDLQFVLQAADRETC